MKRLLLLNVSHLRKEEEQLGEEKLLLLKAQHITGKRIVPFAHIHTVVAVIYIFHIYNSYICSCDIYVTSQLQIYKLYISVSTTVYEQREQYVYQ